MITEAIQDYLKAIYSLSESNETVTTNRVAERLEVSQASVTGMLKKLAKLKLILHKPYYGVELTEPGRKIALEMIRHHRLLELYLVEALGYSWDKVHDEAEKLEHVISEELEEKIAEFLGHPETDPHGAPIPDKNGSVAERQVVALACVEGGQRVRVQQVSDHDPEMLRYLGEKGIYPEIILNVIEKAPFDGPLVVRVKDQLLHLGVTLTQCIFVVPVGPITKKR